MPAIEFSQLGILNEENTSMLTNFFEKYEIMLSYKNLPILH